MAGLCRFAGKAVDNEVPCANPSGNIPVALKRRSRASRMVSLSVQIVISRAVREIPLNDTIKVLGQVPIALRLLRLASERFLLSMPNQLGKTIAS